ncbi:MAG: aminodeoxychorismate/anthranilate synthase component II, partial [Flavobacterium sp.]
CLGQQAIAEAFGGSLLNPEKVHHGVATEIKITVSDENLYEGMGNEIEVGRYHSWCVDPATLPDVLEVTAVDKSGQIMSLRHRVFDVKGVQFHPESVLTPHGKLLLQNWLNY